MFIVALISQYSYASVAYSLGHENKLPLVLGSLTEATSAAD